MPTDKQSIETINQTVDRELFGVEPGDVRRNTRETQIKNRLRKINTELTSDVNVDPIEVISAVINKERMGSRTPSKLVTETNKKRVFNQINEAFKLSQGQVEDTDRVARYADYRLIDQYIPEITDSLDVLRDSILSPDDISKKSVFWHYDGKLSEDEEKIFESNMKILFEKYNLEKYISDKIRTTLLLGDGFTIVGSLAKELNRMLNENEEVDGFEGTVLTESMLDIDPKVRSSIRAYYESITRNPKKTSTKKSLQENFEGDFEKYLEKTRRDVVDKVNSNVTFIRDPYKMLTDMGRYHKDTLGLKPEIKKELDINGVYFKSLKPEDVIKLEIDGTCIGYLVLNRTKSAVSGFGTGHGLNPNPGAGSMLDLLTQQMSPDQGSAAENDPNSLSKSSFAKAPDFLKQGNTALAYETIIDLLVQGISKKIDNKFIEKNEHFRDVIFALVKADYIINKEVEITFVEASLVEHVKIDSLDTYGVSRLAASLFPAKLYLGLLMTNMMVKINQGRDKRVYYIETGLDADIESNVEQLIKDTKSTEIPTSAFSNGTSVSTVMSQVGALESYYIPVIEGSRPFDIDTISGISVDINDELQDKLLKSAIIGTGVPYNYVDASADLDFARSLSMQNQGFVKKVVNYQQEFSAYFSRILRKMYEYEFGDTEADRRKAKKIKVRNKQKGLPLLLDDEDEFQDRINIENIEVVFPEPIVLNMSTNNEQIESTNTTIDYITEMYVDGSAEDADEQKRKFKKKLARNIFMKNLDWDRFDELFEEMGEDSTLDSIKQKLYPKDSAEEETSDY